MAEPQTPQNLNAPEPQRGGMFAEPAAERSFPTTAVAIAGAAILILVAVLLLLGHRGAASPAPNVLQPLANYAPNLAITNVAMSEATSLSGGKSTYIDGHIANHGAAIVSGATMQVLFANDEAMPPQIETVPLTLIRMRQPYIDTEPVSAAPLAPGAEADFRLIFEDVKQNWNQQTPEIHVTQVTTR
jgi:hypothetical protein